MSMWHGKGQHAMFYRVCGWHVRPTNAAYALWLLRLSSKQDFRGVRFPYAAPMVSLTPTEKEISRDRQSR